MKKSILTVLLAAAPFVALAQALQVEHAWIRATVPGQQGTGGFMTLSSKEGVKITRVSAPASIGVAELHEMAMEGDIMKMRAVGVLQVPAGKSVELKPGGYHLMLVGLKTQLTPGTKVPVVFHYQDAKGVTGKMEVKIEVGSMGQQHMHSH